MRRYLVEITLPASDLTCDIFVPADMQVGTLAQLSANAFGKLAGSRYRPSPAPILCEKSSGQILDPDEVIQQTHIRNGSKLLLY